jgi:uncharacterized membrane protein YphA (DoxX/SURF4 family)
MIETVADAAPAAIDRPTVRWTPATRIAFRFCFLYFGLYVVTTQMLHGIVVIPNRGFPPLETLPPFRNVIQWTALHAFGVTQTIVITGSGSGDKIANWVAAFVLIVVAATGSAVWSAVDRKRGAYPSLDRWFRVFMRFALGSTMLSYAMVKIFPLQMPYPSLTRLLEPFGNFSPMGVLWYSVGASPGWERFAGCMELAAAVLLFVPWLSRLGAIVCVADAVQIFTLNMTYDVPVKLFSFHLILMSLFLLAPDMKMLVEAVVRRRPGHPALIAAQLAFAVYFISISAYSAQTGWHSFGGGAPKPPFYGIWNVDRMFVDGIERSPLVTDYGRVRRVVIQNGTALSLQRMDETFSGYPVKTFTLHRIDPDHLTVTGSLDGHTVDMRTSLVDRSRLLLVSRGFNWIQEYPFNR